MRSVIKGIIITAAFIGPGTITTASLVGAQLGYTLIWALVFSLFATYVLQEMASRLGSVTKIGLSQAILSQHKSKVWRLFASVLICSAIGIGNAAYEGGNLSGAGLGLSVSFGGSIATWSLALGLLAALLIVSNRYQMIEKVLVGLVGVMSLVFISLMFVAGIHLTNLVSGVLLKQSMFSNTALLLAIIGTTIVPYNLFLHAGMSARDAQQGLPKNDSKGGLFASIGIGGLVTFAVMSSAATAFFATGIVMDKANIASQLEPLLGEYAKVFFGLGLFCAGLTSAITAPLAASYAISGVFNWQNDLTDWRFKSVSLAIIVIGVMVSFFGASPFAIIVIAQVANALLLPISAVLLILVCNNQTMMGQYKNSAFNNIAAGLVILTVLSLALSKLYSMIA